MKASKEYIRLNRNIINSSWYKNNIARSVFLHIVLSARIIESPIKKGETILSYNAMANNLGLSVLQVITAINDLKSMGEITITIEDGYKAITVVHMDEYLLLDFGGDE